MGIATEVNHATCDGKRQEAETATQTIGKVSEGHEQLAGTAHRCDHERRGERVSTAIEEKLGPLELLQEEQEAALEVGLER